MQTTCQTKIFFAFCPAAHTNPGLQVNAYVKFDRFYFVCLCTNLRHLNCRFLQQQARNPHKTCLSGLIHSNFELCTNLGHVDTFYRMYNTRVISKCGKKVTSYLRSVQSKVYTFYTCLILRHISSCFWSRKLDFFRINGRLGFDFCQF